MSEVEHVLGLQCRLGEGSRWNVDEQTLYFVDIENGLLFKFYPQTGEYECFDMGLPVGALAFREAGGLVLATKQGIAFWDEQEQNLSFVADPEAGKPSSRFNDGSVDRQGRFWAGTLSQDPTSSLYRLDSDLSLHVMETGLTISNGIGWSPDNRTMYLTDSPRQVIYAYDFDMDTGNISNRRVFVRVHEEGVHPDGLAVDSEGFVWSAQYAGWRVVRYDPQGKVDREIRLPVANVTCCAFGGPNLDDLYITTAWSGLSREDRAAQPLAGDLFRVRVGVSGLPESKFRG